MTQLHRNPGPDRCDAQGPLRWRRAAYRLAWLVICLSGRPVSGALAANPAGPDALGEPAVGVGIGTTFLLGSNDTHATGSLVLPVAASWDGNRWEVVAFRLVSPQRDVPWPDTRRTLAESYWAFSVARRWTFVRRSGWRAFIGVGAAYKTTRDYISASRSDVASELGLRFALPTRRVSLELAARHWSNAGLDLPNRGQNLATVSLLWHAFRPDPPD